MDTLFASTKALLRTLDDRAHEVTRSVAARTYSTQELRDSKYSKPSPPSAHQQTISRLQVSGIVFYLSGVLASSVFFSPSVTVLSALVLGTFLTSFFSSSSASFSLHIQALQTPQPPLLE